MKSVSFKITTCTW